VSIPACTGGACPNRKSESVVKNVVTSQRYTTHIKHWRGSPGEMWQTHLLPRFRNPSTGDRTQHPYRAGALGVQAGRDDHDLYPCHAPQFGGGSKSRRFDPERLICPHRVVPIQSWWRVRLGSIADIEPSLTSSPRPLGAESRTSTVHAGEKALANTPFALIVGLRRTRSAVFGAERV